MAICGVATAEGTLSFSSGFDYSSGKYGDATRTEVATLPFAAKYENGPWTFKASLPYVSLDGPSNVVADSGDQVVIQGTTPRHRRSEGWGDLVLGMGWSAYEGNGWLLDLAGKVKVATGDASRGLSTGRNDYSLQVDAYRKVGAVTLFGTLGKRWMGDPDGVDLRNPWYGTLGCSMRLNPVLTAGLSYDYRAKLQGRGAPVREATAFLAYRFNDAWKLQLYAVTGYSTSSPDVGGGFLVVHSR